MWPCSLSELPTTSGWLHTNSSMQAEYKTPALRHKQDTKYVTLPELRQMMHPSSGLLWSPWFRWEPCAVWFATPC